MEDSEVSQWKENDQEVAIGKKDERIPVKVKTVTEKGKELYMQFAEKGEEINWMQLKDILDFGLKQEKELEFNKEVCRSMVAMMDVDFSGKLSYDEFKALWADINNWRAVFKLYDEDGSRRLNAFELRDALNSAGFMLSNPILNILMHRYGTAEGNISFEDFIMCAVRVKTMFDSFRDKDPTYTNIATFSMVEWLQKSLYC